MGYESTDVVPIQEVIVWSKHAARKKCHPSWDWEDLSGDMMLAVVIRQSQTAEEVSMAFRWGYVDWIRKKFGRDENSAKKGAMKEVSMQVKDDSGEYRELDFPDPFVNVELTAELSFTQEALLKILKHERERAIAQMWMDGFVMGEIAQICGVTESRICQIITHRIKPVLDKLNRIVLS